MRGLRKFSVIALAAMVLAVLSLTGTILAASSATITFDFVSDPGDLADGPDFDVVGTGLVDDGSGCDTVTVIMVDATGTVTDVDTICLNLITGQGGSDGDYGSSNGGYFPIAGPVTYAVFDLTATDLANLTGFGDSDPEYAAYVIANATFLTEGYVDVQGLASGTPFSFIASTPASGCRLAIPAGSVVGEAPLGAQVYYEPGNVSPGIVLNPGTYTVVGQDESQTYYKLFFSCSFIWVRKDTMQPSWQPPQNGAPLPTSIVG